MEMRLTTSTQVSPEHKRVSQLRSRMRAHTPRGEASSPLKRNSPSNRFRSSTTGLPRAQSSLRESMNSSFASNHSSHELLPAIDDFQRGTKRKSTDSESARPSSRESFKENLAPPDADEYEKYRKEVESLKAEIGTLQYRMHTADQEKEIVLSQQNSKLEQARRKEQEEILSRQASEAAAAKASELAQAARKEAEALQEASIQEKDASERRIREAVEEARQLQEQLEELSTTRDETLRVSEKKIGDLQIQVASAQQSLHDYEQERQAKETTIQHLQTQTGEKDDLIAQLEAQALRLRAQSGDAETINFIKKELSEQVQHIRALESTNRDQSSELKHLRAINRAVEVVEEEKRSLQRRVEAFETLEDELGETRLQRQRLEDERLAWIGYLKKSSETGDDEFDSPEAMARALVQERLTTASYLEKLGASQGDIAAYQNTIATMEEESRHLRSQMEEAKTAASASSTDKVRLRLERQRAMAVKEVEYLRAQLKTFDTEDETMQPEQFDLARATRITELEGLIDEYKAEVQILHAQLSSADGLAPTMSTKPIAGTKRSRADEEEAEEQIGQLNRKNRKLQDDISALQTQILLLEKDVIVGKEQLTAAKNQSQTRVLSLRSNPTSDHEAIKRSTLEALQKENNELLATLRSKTPSSSGVPCIPTSVLSAMEREIGHAKAETASAQKSARRLKEVWGSKSQEFKEAIFSTLGWTVTFIPNGKMRVESTFHPSQTDEHENSIVFDGERGTMKVGGGPKSAFAQRISDQIGFWVREKGCIPGFLAALTLEFYEEHTRAAIRL